VSASEDKGQALMARKGKTDRRAIGQKLELTTWEEKGTKGQPEETRPNQHGIPQGRPGQEKKKRKQNRIQSQKRNPQGKTRRGATLKPGRMKEEVARRPPEESLKKGGSPRGEAE